MRLSIWQILQFMSLNHIANKIDVFMQLALYSAKIHLMHTEISIYANPLRHNMSLYLCICLYIFEQVCDVFVFLI